MLFVNRITEPGGVRRLELRPDIVRVVLQDGTERLYRSSEPSPVGRRSDYGSQDVESSARRVNPDD